MNTTTLLSKRGLLNQTVREFFHRSDYLEVQTPIIVPQPGVEAHMDYFETSLQGYRGESKPYWLRSSPEVHMKTLLSQGLERIFQLSPCFRNGGEFTPWHHPEFTMLEWYKVDSTLEDLMEETHTLIHQSFDALGNSSLPKLTKLSVAEAFQEFTGLELIDKDPDLGAKAHSKNLGSLNGEEDFETAFYKLQLELIEPNLKSLGYCCLYNYPASLAILSKLKDGWAQRFEFYLEGIELCNAYHELTDAEENKDRIQQTMKERTQLGKPPHDLDKQFQAALDKGLPACSGNALGIDRLLALALGLDGIPQLLPFRDQLNLELFDI